LPVQRFEVLYGPSQFAFVHSLHSMRHSKGCTTLYIHKPGRGHSVGPVPESGGDRARWFLDDNRDDCRCIEVDDQRRCSATRSLTGPWL
jgi:hypothetical protein